MRFTDRVAARDRMEAIILAGGLGTRLRPVVPEVPKSLAPVASRPFLAIVLDRLRRQGITSFVLSVGYRHELIQEAFGKSYEGLPVRYAVEREPLGTGGAIRFAATQCTGHDVVIVNGDSYVEADVRKLQDRHRRSRARLTVCTVAVPDAGRYGALQVAGDRIVGFMEKGTGPGLINAGMYLMRRDLLETMTLPAAFSFERDVLAACLSEIDPHALLVEGKFIDIGVPEDYARAQDLFA